MLIRWFRERRAVGEPVRTVAVARTPKDRRPRSDETERHGACRLMGKPDFMTTHDQDDARRKAIDEMREIALQLSEVGDRSAANGRSQNRRFCRGAATRNAASAYGPAFPAVEDLPAARKNASKRLAEILLRLHTKGDHDAAELVYAPLDRGARGVESPQ